MAYTSVEAATKFLYIAKSDGVPLSTMKLQKLIYLAQEESIKSKKDPLISEDPIADLNGPVYEKLSEYLKEDTNSDTSYIELKKDKVIVNINNIFIEVYNKFKYATGKQLSNATHKKGSPWYLASKTEDKVITSEIIRLNVTLLTSKLSNNYEHEIEEFFSRPLFYLMFFFCLLLVFILIIILFIYLVIKVLFGMAITLAVTLLIIFSGIISIVLSIFLGGLYKYHDIRIIIAFLKGNIRDWDKLGD